MPVVFDALGILWTIRRNFKAVPNRSLERIQIFRYALELFPNIEKKYFLFVEKLAAQSDSLKPQSHLTIRQVAESLRPVFCSQSPTGRAKWSAIEKTIADSKIDRQQSQVIGIGRKWFYKRFAKPLTTPAVCEQSLVDDERLPTGPMQSYNFCGLFMSREDWYLVYCLL